MGKNTFVDYKTQNRKKCGVAASVKMRSMSEIFIGKTGKDL